MRRLALLLALLLPRAAHALFHVSVINEVMAGTAADPNAQYVEIRMLTRFQNAIKNTRVTAFSCDGNTHTVLLLVPSNAVNEGPTVTWVVATPSFAAAAGVTPDFTWNPATGTLPACGMVCYGAPGAIVPPPASWDPNDPNQYVDCVAYGGYTGPRKTSTQAGTPTSGTPTALGPGDGMHSLSRMGTTGDNQADFALACPTPTNNAGMQGGFGPCTPPTTSTTSTTMAPAHCTDAAAEATVRSAIATTCDCTTPGHSAYVRCAARVIGTAVKSGTLPRACKAALRACAARSTCGRSGVTACCRTTAKGRTTCAIKRTGACRSSKRARACAGTQASCCDACSTPCPAAIPGSTTTHPRVTTTSLY